MDIGIKSSTIGSYIYKSYKHLNFLYALNNGDIQKEEKILIKSSLYNLFNYYFKEQKSLFKIENESIIQFNRFGNSIEDLLNKQIINSNYYVKMTMEELYENIKNQNSEIQNKFIIPEIQNKEDTYEFEMNGVKFESTFIPDLLYISFIGDEFTINIIDYKSLSINQKIENEINTYHKIDYIYQLNIYKKIFLSILSKNSESIHDIFNTSNSKYKINMYLFPIQEFFQIKRFKKTLLNPDINKFNKLFFKKFLLEIKDINNLNIKDVVEGDNNKTNVNGELFLQDMTLEDLFIEFNNYYEKLETFKIDGMNDVTYLYDFNNKNDKKDNNLNNVECISNLNNLEEVKNIMSNLFEKILHKETIDVVIEDNITAYNFNCHIKISNLYNERVNIVNENLTPLQKLIKDIVNKKLSIFEDTEISNISLIKSKKINGILNNKNTDLSKNWIIESPTNSGKMLSSFIISDKYIHLDKKVIFITSKKILTDFTKQEILDDFNENNKYYKFKNSIQKNQIVVMHGGKKEIQYNDEKFKDVKIIVSTYDYMLELLHHLKKDSFEVSLIICDEIHTRLYHQEELKEYDNKNKVIGSNKKLNSYIEITKLIEITNRLDANLLLMSGTLTKYWSDIFKNTNKFNYIKSNYHASKVKQEIETTSDINNFLSKTIKYNVENKTLSIINDNLNKHLEGENNRFVKKLKATETKILTVFVYSRNWINTFISEFEKNDELKSKVGIIAYYSAKGSSTINEINEKIKNNNISSKPYILLTTNSISEGIKIESHIGILVRRKVLIKDKINSRVETFYDKNTSKQMADRFARGFNKDKQYRGGCLVIDYFPDTKEFKNKLIIGLNDNESFLLKSALYFGEEKKELKIGLDKIKKQYSKENNIYFNLNNYSEVIEKLINKKFLIKTDENISLTEEGEFAIRYGNWEKPEKITQENYKEKIKNNIYMNILISNFLMNDDFTDGIKVATGEIEDNINYLNFNDPFFHYLSRKIFSDVDENYINENLVFKILSKIDGNIQKPSDVSNLVILINNIKKEYSKRVVFQDSLSKGSSISIALMLILSKLIFIKLNRNNVLWQKIDYSFIDNFKTTTGMTNKLKDYYIKLLKIEYPNIEYSENEIIKIIRINYNFIIDNYNNDNFNNAKNKIIKNKDNLILDFKSN